LRCLRTARPLAEVSTTRTCEPKEERGDHSRLLSFEHRKHRRSVQLHPASCSGALHVDRVNQRVTPKSYSTFWKGFTRKANFRSTKDQLLETNPDGVRSGNTDHKTKGQGL